MDGNVLCVGCKALIDLSNRYTETVLGSCTKDAQGNGKDQEYIPGRTEDLCSYVDGCANDLKCTDSFDGSECLRFSLRCQCLPKNGRPTECVSSDTCPGGETCVRHTILDKKICVSCHAARHIYHYVEEEKGKCNAKKYNKPRDIPVYPTSPDGYSLDTCTNDIQCRKGLKCKEYSKKQDCSKNDTLCVCLKPKGLTECKNNKKCHDKQKGEVCANGSFPLKRNRGMCVSHVYDTENLPNDVYVEAPLERGNNLSGDGCSSELDCAYPRACTHPSDEFGGCAGRKNCVCQPILRDVCDDSGNGCVKGEKCVNVPDAKNKNYCKSKKVPDSFLENEIGKEVEELPTGGGWIGDTCKTSEDCKDAEFERKCYHFLERFEDCDGDRKGCLCMPEIKEDTRGRILESKKCTGKNGCGRGESCVKYIDSLENEGFCYSKDAEANDPTLDIFKKK